MLDRRADVVGTGPLPSVRDALQSGLRRSAEHPREPLDAGALAAGAVQGHDAASGVPKRHLERALRVVQAVVAGDVCTRALAEAVAALAGGEPVDHRLDRPEPVLVEPEGV